MTEVEMRLANGRWVSVALGDTAYRGASSPAPSSNQSPDLLYAVLYNNNVCGGGSSVFSAASGRTPMIGTNVDTFC